MSVRELSARMEAVLEEAQRVADGPRSRIERNYRMAYCATVTVHNAQGDALHTIRYVSSLRTHWEIACFKAHETQLQGDVVTIERAAEILGIAPSTVHRWLNDGFIAGEQLTAGAPWRLRITNELGARFVDQTPPGYVAMLEATLALGVSRQTILQRVKRGELHAVHVKQGRRKGLRIKLPDATPGLFDRIASDGGAV